MQRRQDSHKGENGKVAVIGGSRSMHGAPLLAALAAEASGVDLVYVCLPAVHEDVAKHASLNFQVHPFAGNELTAQDVEPILELLATMDSAVLGCGIAHTPESIAALNDIIAAASCNLVLDATALHEHTLSLLTGKNAILTPHLGELERMNLAVEDIASAAQQYGVTIVLKGQIDHITSHDGLQQDVTGGNAGLTVGGTGDVLAGLIGGLRTQEHDHTTTSRTACQTIKAVAEGLFQNYGCAYTAQDVIQRIPSHVHTHDISHD